MAAGWRLVVRSTRNEKEPMATARVRRPGPVPVVAVFRCSTLSIQMGNAHVGTEGQRQPRVRDRLAAGGQDLGVKISRNRSVHWMPRARAGTGGGPGSGSGFWLLALAVSFVLYLLVGLPQTGN